MGTTVDSLEIQLQMQSQKASSSIDTLIDKLGTLNTSLTKINGSGLSGVANGVDKLSRSMNGLKNVGAADYARLAKGIEKISNLDSSQISKAATAIVGFGKGLQSLNSVNVSQTSKQVADLAKGIAQLGYKSSTNAIENIPKLATAMRQLMSELSKAPKVSQNLIDMTNALAKLSRTGAASGRAANALSGGLNNYTKATHNASRGTKGLASALGKMYATYWLLFRAIGKIGDSITIASDLVEVQNVVDTVFGNMSSKVEEFAQKSIEQFGMSELSFKQYASRFQAMGAAMGIDTSSIESANAFLNKSTSGYVGLSDSMADVSLTLTQLTADMASFYNVSQKDVAEDLAAIFTGETRPLRTYGLDLTQATLAEWAMKQGLDANVQSMSQAEKTMLRYQYVLVNTTAAQGDFARTANTWANQIRILQEQVKKFASVIGTGFIAAFKPILQTLNTVMAKVIDFTQNVLNALGQIFGWKFEISGGGITDDLGADLSESMGDVSTGTGNAAGNAGDLSDNLGNAVENAKKLKTITLGIDELNINAPQDDKATGGGSSGGGAGSGGGGTGGGGTGSGGTGLTTTIKRNDKLLEAYKSNIKTLEQLGEYIGNTLTNAMNKIPWNKVYEGARNFGTGLADFLNGLISPELFGSTGRTIANSLNTAIYAALSFGQTFDFYDFGVSIATGINEFFRNFDFGSLAETLNVWVDGIKETIKGFLNTISGKDIVNGATEFLSGLEIDTVAVLVGAIAWKLGAGALLKTGLVSLIQKGIGKIVLNLTGVELGKVTFKGVAKAIGGALKKAIGKASGSIVSTISGAFGISGGAATAVFAGIIAAVAGIGLAIKDLWDTSETFRDAVSEMWQKISEAFIKAKNTIWDNALQPLWEKIKEFADSVKEFWGTIYIGYESSGLKQLFEDILVVIGDRITSGIVNALKIVSNTFVTVGKVAGILIDILSGVIDFATGIFSGDWGKAWDSVEKITKNVVDGIIGNFKEMWGNITSIFSPVIDFFKEKFGKAYENITMIFSPLANWFGEKWRNTKDKFRDTVEFFRTKFTSGYNEVKNAFNPIATWFQGKWNDVKTAFRDVIDFFYKKFSSAYRKIVDVFSPLANWFGGVWSSVKNVFFDLADWFWSKFKSGYNSVTTVFSPLTNWFGGIWNGIKNVFSDLTSWFSNGFQSAYNAVTRIWDGIGGYFSKVANWIVDPIESAVNGVIKGINWVFEAVGAKAPLSLWNAPKFATGSNGLPSDTIGVVNDQAGSTYKELIVPPHGKPFIPEGRNVMLPMEKGTKIMPAGQTKELMNGMPKFKTGIGDFFGGMWEKVSNFTGDVLDYIIHPSKIVQIAIDKFTDLSNVGSFFIPLATGAINKLFDTVVGFVTKKFDEIGGAEKAVKWAIGIANDNSHGYDQNSRWGYPDYDCSSLVITAFEKAGIKMKSAGATYTGDMYNVARSLGFADVTGGVNLSTGYGLKRGDILLNRENHTALYIGNGKVVQASSNEFGGIKGGLPGDQTGQEINVSSYYNYPWNDVLRFVKRYKDGIGKISIADLIPQYSVGGFPEDGLFMANHNELVGQFSDGRTAVANNLDIQKGIEDAAYRGFSRANAENREQENLLRELIQAVRDGKEIRIDGRTLVSITDSRRARNGYSFT